MLKKVKQKLVQTNSIYQLKSCPAKTVTELNDQKINNIQIKLYVSLERRRYIFFLSLRICLLLDCQKGIWK